MLPDPAVITLTTDFGLLDPFVGVMKGVIATITPQTHIIDLSHGIAAHNIREAAFTIGMHYSFFPEGTVHVVIVDPGVGSARRPVLVSTGRYYFIGPDNGVFSLIYEKERTSLQVIHITESRFFLKTKSPTFQGRDIFAPVAALLAGGLSFENFGERITDAETLDLPKPSLRQNVLKGEIIHIDRFGNAISNIGQTDIADLRKKHPCGSVKVFLREREVPLKEFYGQAAGKELHGVINSSEYLEFFINRGNAAGTGNISIGDRVAVSVIP